MTERSKRKTLILPAVLMMLGGFVFAMFGNAAQMKRAIDRATPNKQKLEREQKRSEQIIKELDKIEKGKKRLVDALFDGTFTKDEVTERKEKAEERKAKLTEELNLLSKNLRHRADPKKVSKMTKDIARRFRGMRVKLRAGVKSAMHNYDDMNWEDRRALCEMVFSGKTRDDKRMGIYIEWQDKENWKFNIHGHLIDLTGLSPNKEFDFEESGGGQIFTGLEDVKQILSSIPTH